LSRPRVGAIGERRLAVPAFAFDYLRSRVSLENPIAIHYVRRLRKIKAFSSEVDRYAVSRQDNASKQKPGARFDSNETEKALAQED
jgi:hypothetical protein